MLLIVCLICKCSLICCIIFLIVTLSPMFPDKLMLGMEIRVKVNDYVVERIKALRLQHPGQYENIACIRTNAMKYLPNYFKKGQVIMKILCFLYLLLIFWL